MHFYRICNLVATSQRADPLRRLLVRPSLAGEVARNSEVGTGLHECGSWRDFTMEAALRRVKEHGDLFEPVLA